MPLPCHIHSVSNSRTRREIVRSLICAPPLLTSSQLTVHATTATMIAKQIVMRIHMIVVALFFLSRTKRIHWCVNSVALGRRIKGSNRLNRCSESTLPTRTAYTFTRHLAVTVASLFIRNSGLAGSRSENLGWPYLPERNGHWVLGIGEDADVESYFVDFIDSFRNVCDGDFFFSFFFVFTRISRLLVSDEINENE